MFAWNSLIKEKTNIIYFKILILLLSYKKFKFTKMEIDKDKIDDAVLALLYLTTLEDEDVLRAWKGHDWDSLDRLHEKGLISDPKSKAKSVVMSEDGAKLSRELFMKMFAKEI